MRMYLILAAAVPLVACSDTETDVPNGRVRQETACSAAIAAHVHRPVTEVSSRWIAETDGIAKVEARDGGRIHICDVDSSGTVRGYVHPAVE